MKNYYLKRIDEVKTQIGSETPPEPVATATRVGAGVSVPLLRAGAKAVQKSVPTGTAVKRAASKFMKTQGKRYKRTKKALSRLDRMKKSKIEREREREEQLANDTERAFRRQQFRDSNREARKKRLENLKRASDTKLAAAQARAGFGSSQATVDKETERQKRLDRYKYEAIVYTQIGYILAESMGLIEEGKFKNLANKAAEAGKQTAFVAKEVGKDIVYTVPKETVAMTKEAIAAVKKRLPKSKK